MVSLQQTWWVLFVVSTYIMSEKLLQAWDLHLRQFLHDAALKVCRVLLMIQLLLQTPTQHVSSDGKKKNKKNMQMIRRSHKKVIE